MRAILREHRLWACIQPDVAMLRARDDAGLEVRDATIPPLQRRFLPNKEWRRMTTKECLALLDSAGIIETQGTEGKGSL